MKPGFAVIGGGGAGGGGSTASWGPNFGGTNGDQFGVAAQLLFENLEAEWEPFQCACELTFPELDAVYDPQSVGASITELKYSATLSRWANSAVNDGPDNWTNPTNAQGVSDEVNATRAGQALASTDANLRLNYLNVTGGLETFTIDLVELGFYADQTGTVANNGGLHYEYRLDGGTWVSLEIFTGNVSHNDRRYDITAAVGGDWTKIDALEVRVRAVLGVATTLVTCSLDAVRVIVDATKTITP